RTQTNRNVQGSSTCHTQRITQYSDNKTFTLGINHRWPCQVLLSPLHSNPVSLSTLSLTLSPSLPFRLSLPLSLSLLLPFSFPSLSLSLPLSLEHTYVVSGERVAPHNPYRVNLHLFGEG